MAFDLDGLLDRMLRGDDEAAPRHRRAIAPGRVPATARIPRVVVSDASAVQRKQVRAARIDDAHVAGRAAEGVTGAGGPLPFAAQIALAFGPDHDVERVRAHVGGAAAHAAEAIGAEAYATGEDIAFRGAPDLHTAAHEAAHVIQQRAGVTGVGQVGDAHERHADEIADRVVRGESVAALLPHAAGPGATAVQRRVLLPSQIYVPDPVSVTWAGDTFAIDFDADELTSGTAPGGGRGYQLFARVQYTGMLPLFADQNVDVASKRAIMSASFDDHSFNPAPPVIAPDQITIDLFSDGKTILTIKHVCTIDALPDPNRRHQLGLYINGAFVDYANLRVGDPHADANATQSGPAPAPSTPWTFSPTTPQPIEITPQSVMPPPRQAQPLTLHRKSDGAVFSQPGHDPGAWLQAFLTFYQFQPPIDDDVRGASCIFNYSSSTLAEVAQIAIAQGKLAGYDYDFNWVVEQVAPKRQAGLPPSNDGERTLEFIYTFVPYTYHAGINTASGGDKPGVQGAFQVNFALRHEEAGPEIAFGGAVTVFPDPGPDGRLRIQTIAPYVSVAWASDVIKDLLTLQTFGGIAAGVSRQQSPAAGVMKLFPMTQVTPAGGQFMFHLPGGVFQIGGQLAAQLTTGIRDGMPTTGDITGGVVISVELDKSGF